MVSPFVRAGSPYFDFGRSGPGRIGWSEDTVAPRWLRHRRDRAPDLRDHVRGYIILAFVTGRPGAQPVTQSSIGPGLGRRRRPCFSPLTHASTTSTRSPSVRDEEEGAIAAPLPRSGWRDWSFKPGGPPRARLRGLRPDRRGRRPRRRHGPGQGQRLQAPPVLDGYADRPLPRPLSTRPRCMPQSFRLLRPSGYLLVTCARHAAEGQDRRRVASDCSRT